jgi:hypothetical protein
LPSSKESEYKAMKSLATSNLDSISLPLFLSIQAKRRSFTLTFEGTNQENQDSPFLSLPQAK